MLRDYASACIDISDGLIADLGHITEASQLGARIDFEKIPCSDEFKANLTDETLTMPLVLSGGDDYELCFTIAEVNQVTFESVMRKNNFSVTCIGEIESQPGIRCFNHGTLIDIQETGYQHFID